MWIRRQELRYPIQKYGKPYRITVSIYMYFLQIFSDSVGYGFVIRGIGPTYVQTVDPEGPAADAGLKVVILASDSSRS